MAETSLVPENPQDKPVKTRKPLPFNITDETRQRFLKHFEKSSDDSLNALLDAFEQRSDEPVDQRITELQGNIQNLQKQVRELTEKKQTAEQTANAKIVAVYKLEAQIEKLKAELAQKPTTQEPDPRIEQLNSELMSLKGAHKKLQDEYQKLKEAQQTPADDSALKEAQKTIKELQDSIAEKDRMLREMDQQTKGLPDIKDLKAKLGAAEDRQKEDKKLIEGYQEQKKAFEEKVKKLEKLIEGKDATIEELKSDAKAAGFAPYDGDQFLSAFPNVIGLLLERTAEKLTDARKDGKTITPPMILGDMFLKYTCQKWTKWFYNWVLTDDEIVEIAQSINPNIKSVRMLRKVLNIDQELN